MPKQHMTPLERELGFRVRVENEYRAQVEYLTPEGRVTTTRPATPQEILMFQLLIERTPGEGEKIAKAEFGVPAESAIDPLGTPREEYPRGDRDD